jgi:hypothetical protein
VVVYGPTQEDQKANFQAKRVNMCSREALPILIGCDFNILRRPMRKINPIIMIDGRSFLMRS